MRSAAASTASRAASARASARARASRAAPAARSAARSSSTALAQGGFGLGQRIVGARRRASASSSAAAVSRDPRQPARHRLGLGSSAREVSSRSSSSAIRRPAVESRSCHLRDARPRPRGGAAPGLALAAQLVMRRPARHHRLRASSTVPRRASTAARGVEIVQPGQRRLRLAQLRAGAGGLFVVAHHGKPERFELSGGDVALGLGRLTRGWSRRLLIGGAAGLARANGRPRSALQPFGQAIMRLRHPRRRRSASARSCAAPAAGSAAAAAAPRRTAHPRPPRGTRPSARARHRG
jgi:hypothetical protein